MLAIDRLGLPTIMIMLITKRFFEFREKKLEIEARTPPRRPRNMRPATRAGTARPRTGADRHRWRRADCCPDRGAARSTGSAAAQIAEPAKAPAA